MKKSKIPKPSRQKKFRVSLSLTLTVRNCLDALAREKNTSRSAIAEELLSGFLIPEIIETQNNLSYKDMKVKAL